MAFDIAQEKQDFKDIELDRFGETVLYTDGISGASKHILAIRPTQTMKQMSPPSTSFNQIKQRGDLLISRLDITEVHKGKDTVTMKVEPDDVLEKTLKVTHCTEEYGAWRLGLV